MSRSTGIKDPRRYTFVDVCSWPRPCENSSAFRARGRMPARLRIMKLNHSAQIRLDTVSENCIFYISTTYEFSHSQGPLSPSQCTRFDRRYRRHSGLGGTAFVFCIQLSPKRRELDPTAS